MTLFHEKFRDKTRDELHAHLRSLGVDAHMAPRGRAEEEIAGGFSLGVIEILGEHIKWVNVRRGPGGGNYPGLHLDCGVPDPRLASAFPKVMIKIARRTKFGFLGGQLGPCVAVRWEGVDFGLGILTRLEGDRSLSSPPQMWDQDLEIHAYPDHRCWILSRRQWSAPSRQLWNCFQAIAGHLLATPIPSSQ